MGWRTRWGLPWIQGNLTHGSLSDQSAALLKVASDRRAPFNISLEDTAAGSYSFFELRSWDGGLVCGLDMTNNETLDTITERQS